MRLEISQFGGMAPLVDPTALGDQFAELAKNVRFDKGVLAPGALRLVTTSEYPDATLINSGTKAVAKMFEDGTRFAFTEAAASNAFPSPVSPTDTWGRVYFMGPQGPSFSTSDQYTKGALNRNPISFQLGVPAPDSAPSVTADVEKGDSADEVSVAYAFAYVDRYGHEGALGLATAPVEVTYNLPFTVTLGFSESPPRRVNFDGGVRRVYRATFDGSSAVWQFLVDVPISQTSFADTIPVGDEGESVISENWHPAPDPLRELCLVGASFAAGILGHYICYSELKLPHAWPKELQYPLKYEPVALLPMNNGLFVATTGRPYWAEGSDPYSAIPREMPVNAPCLSADSVVDMGDVAMYLTPEGIMAVGAGQAQLVSDGFIDREGMLALVDESSTAFVFDRRYVFSTRDGRWMGFAADQGFVEYEFGFPPSEFLSVTYSVRDNRHYFAMKNGRIRMVDFQGSAANVEWHSKHWRTPPSSFSCVRVEADTYPVRLEVRSQYLGHPWQTSGEMNITGPHVQRLPPGQGTLWQARVLPPENGQVYRITLAQSGQEAS